MGPEEDEMKRSTTAATMILVLSLAYAGSAAAADLPEVYWAEVGATRSLVDIIDLPAAEGEAVGSLVEQHGTFFEGPYGAVPANDPRVPARFRLGQRLAVITERGVVTLKVQGFGAAGGASESHFFLVLDGSPRHAGLRGLVLPPEQVPAGVRLVPAAKGRRAGAVPPARLARARRNLLKALPAFERLRLGPELSRTRAYAIRGRFPGGARLLVALGPAEVGFDERATALLLADARGRLVRTLQPVERTLEQYVPLYTVDLDQDGIDEVVLQSSYYEGAYLHLLHFDEGEIEVLTLTGDGA